MGYIYVSFMVLFTVTGQLLAKKGAQHIGLSRDGLIDIKELLNKYIVLAGIILLITPVFYYLALTQLELSAAFIFTGLNYVFVSIGGKAFFAEKLNTYHYAGITLIFSGVAVFQL